jgi:hypothetical protein
MSLFVLVLSVSSKPSAYSSDPERSRRGAGER